MWCKQLDKELQQFVRKEGFMSAEECYKKISQIITEDKERHKAAVAAVLAQLKANDDFRALIESAGGKDQSATSKSAGVVSFRRRSIRRFDLWGVCSWTPRPPRGAPRCASCSCLSPSKSW